jgi:histidyl-tRNA synthetase
MSKSSLFQPPRGTRDFLPEDVIRKRFVESTIRKVFELYGYQEIITPIFEYPTLWTVRSGEKILDEMFLVRWGGAKEGFEEEGYREWALRPELTAPVCRMFISGGLSTWPKPIKVFYIGQCFRYERPAPGRYREFWQAGLELIGSPYPEADAEVISVAHHTLNELGLKDHNIRIGHLGVLRGLLEENNVDKDTQNILIRKIDKAVSDITKLKLGEAIIDEKGKALDEISIYQSLDESLYNLGIRGNTKEIILKMIDLKGAKEETIKKAKDVFSASERATRALIELNDILRNLESSGIQNYVVDLSVARGLAFYTGMVFEIDIPVLGAQKQVCGGGRYDNLISEFGGPYTPATGFAFGLERLIEAIKKRGVFLPEARRVNVIVTATTEEVRLKATEIAQKIRSFGIRTEIDLMKRSLKDVLSLADNMGIPYVIIIGPKELKENKLLLRNMKDRCQETLTIEEVVRQLTRL